MPELYLGVDAGNTKTVALVCDDQGGVVGSGHAGLGDIYGAARPEDAVGVVVSTVAQALGAAGAKLSDIRSAAFRLAGIDWPEDEDYWRDAVARRFAPIELASVKNDGFALLRCGDLSGVGVAVAAGTGLALAGRGSDGREYALCWWCQDYLGGAGLGNDALRAVFLAELGLGAPTSLTAALVQVYGAADVESLLKQFTRRENPLGHLDRSRAACAVLQAGEDGDIAAQQILDRHAALLADYAILVARKVGLADGVRAEGAQNRSRVRSSAPSSPVRIVLGGSVLSSDHAGLRDRLIAELTRGLPRADVALSVGPPIVGAVLDALAEGGVLLGPAVRDRVLAATMVANRARDRDVPNAKT
jgi:N-acetylglucosamine kinase-like BadF-type ATPase